MRDALKYIVGLALAAALLWWVFRGVDLQKLGASFARASWSLLALAAVVNLGHNVFRVWRWGDLLRPVRSGVRFRPMFAAVIIGYTTTWTIPGRLGELVRPALLSAREDVPVGPCLGTVLADRILDGFAVVLLFGVGIFLSPLEVAAPAAAARVRFWSPVILLGLGGVTVILLAATFVKDSLSLWLEGRSRPVRWLGSLFLSLADGTAALKEAGLLVRISANTLLAWLTIGLGTWLGVLAAGVHVTYPSILVMLLLLAFAIGIPTQGGVGAYHAAMVWGLQNLFGIPREDALAAGILMHLAVTVPVILLGIVLLRTEHVSWHDVLKAARGLRHLGSTGERPPVAVRKADAS